MGDTAMNVPVKTRSHELAQVKEMVPTLIEGLEDADLDGAEELNRIYDEHIEGVEATYPEVPDSDTESGAEASDEASSSSFAAYLSMPHEDWRLLIRHLNRARREHGTLRVGWLQNKFVSRIEDRLEELDN